MKRSAHQRMNKKVFSLTAVLLWVLCLAVSATFAADLEADAWPEIDIWIKLDKAGKNRIETEPKEESGAALGVAIGLYF